MLNSENRYLLKFAWMSIRRNAGRSFFIGFSVSLAVIIAVWVIAFFDGMNAQIEQAVVFTNTGFFQIQEPQYATSTDSSSPRPLEEDLSQKLKSKAIKAYSPELVLDANISTPEGAAGLLALGIIPELHSSLMDISESMVQGSFLSEKDEGAVVIGKELADIFRFKPGDQLVLNYQDQNGGLRSEILNIKGIYKYSSSGFEKKFIYLTQATWQRLFMKDPSSAVMFNRITLMTDNLSAQPQVESIVGGTDLKVKSWKQLNPEMAVVLEFHDGMIRFFFLIIAVTIMMTILTPVRMLWQERFKEIKMLNILGVTANKFWKIGCFEIVLMIAFSAGFSSLLLIAIIGTQSHTGINMSFLNDGIAIERAGIKLPGIIYPLLSPVQILISFGFVIVVLGLSYLWSIHRTLKKLEVPA